jgi:hypothetical protein
MPTLTESTSFGCRSTIWDPITTQEARTWLSRTSNVRLASHLRVMGSAQVRPKCGCGSPTG